MKFFCNTVEHGRIWVQRFSQERALSPLVAKYETSWWLKSNLVLSSIIGQKMSLIALIIWISQGFEKTPKMAQKWSENGFLALSLEPNHLGPKFLHFLGPHTWLDHGQTISQLFWKFTLGALVDFKKRMILREFVGPLGVSPRCPSLLSLHLPTGYRPSGTASLPDVS